MSEDLIVTRREGIVTATFNRPRARNALTYAMYDGLAALCSAIDADKTTKALILTGAGADAFAAGTDIAQFQNLTNEADSLAYEARIDRVLSTLEGCRVPTIAALAGACTGGGAMIAACCDLRIASANLRFGFPIARTLGNCLSAANLARLKRLVGEARVKEMMFTGRLLEAERVHAIGLVTTVVASLSELQEEAEALATLITANAPLSIAATKQALLRQRDRIEPADDLVLSCYMSADFRNAVAAFAARRPPTWTGT